MPASRILPCTTKAVSRVNPDATFLHSVAYRMRVRDFEEITATSFTDSRSDLADELSTGLVMGSRIITGFAWAGRPTACFGAVEPWPGFWSVWMFATDDWTKVAKSATKHILRVTLPAFWAEGAHRVEARSMAGYDTAHNWMIRMGARREATLRAFGKNGEDFDVFVWGPDHV